MEPMVKPPYYDDTVCLVKGMMDVLEDEENAGVCFNAIGTTLIHFMLMCLENLEDPKDRKMITDGVRSLAETVVKIAESDNPVETADEYAILTATAGTQRH